MHDNNSGRVAVLLVNSDLLFTSRILSALERAGYSPDVARTRDAAPLKLQDRPAAVVIVNLGIPALGGLDLVRSVKALDPAPRVLAFISHTKIPEIRFDAAEAGVDKLCANSAITMRLPAIMADLLSGAGPLEEE